MHAESILAWNICKWLDFCQEIQHCVHLSVSVSAWNENKAKKVTEDNYACITEACFPFLCWPSSLKYPERLAAWTFFGCVTIDRREESLFTCACSQRKDVKSIVNSVVSSFKLVGFWTVPARKHSIEKVFSAWKCAKCLFDLIGTQRLFCFSHTELLLSLSFKCCWRIKELNALLLNGLFSVLHFWSSLCLKWPDSILFCHSFWFYRVLAII